MNAVAVGRETTIAVDLHGLSFVVSCPIPAVRAALEARLAHLPLTAADADLRLTYVVGEPLSALPPDARPVYESTFGTACYAAGTDELIARYGRVGMRCAPEEGIAEIVVPEPLVGETWLLSRPLLTLALMEMARRRGLYPLHAACVAWRGRGIVLAGPTGSGKTTLAIALARAGLDFLGDDLVFHTPGLDVRLLGFPDELGLTDGHPAPRGWPKARANLLDVVPAQVVPECKPELLVYLSEDRDAPPALEPVARSEALLDLVPTMLLTHPKTCSAHLAALDDLLSASRPLRARGGDVDALARQIMETIARGKEIQ